MRPRTFRPRMSRSFCGAFPWGGRPSPPRSPTSSPSWPARTRGSSPGWSFRSTEDCGPAAASHHTDDRPSTRRPRSYERVKRPAKNIYLTRKHDHVRPPGKVSYTLTVTDDSLYQGNTLGTRIGTTWWLSSWPSLGSSALPGILGRGDSSEPSSCSHMSPSTPAVDFLILIG